MTKKEKIIKNLKNLSHENPQCINQSELFLLKTAFSKSVIFVETLIGILENTEQSQTLRIKAANFLKWTLNVSPKNTACCFDNLDDLTVHELKQKLIICAKTESKELRRPVCEVIAELAATLIKSRDRGVHKNWNNIFQVIADLHSENNECAVLASLEIAGKLITSIPFYILAYKNMLFAILLASFENKNPRVKIAALETLTVFLRSVKTSESQSFKPLKICALQILEQFLKANDFESINEVLKLVREICLTDPNYFKSQFSCLFNLTLKVVEIAGENSKLVALDCILLQIEQFPEIIDSNIEKIRLLLNAIISNLKDLNGQINSDKKQSCDQENETDFVEKIKTIFERFLVATFNDLIEQEIYIRTLNLFEINKNKEIMLGFFLIGEIAKFVNLEENLKFEKMFSFFEQNAQNENEELKFWAINSLQKVCENLEGEIPEYVSKYSIKVGFYLIDKEINESTIIGLGLLNKAIEKSGEGIIPEHFKILSEILLDNLKIENIEIKENCLKILSILALKTRYLFVEIYEEVLFEVDKILNNNEVSKCKMIGFLLCAILIQNFEFERFKNRFNKYMTELIIFQEQILTNEKSVNFQKYLGLCFLRICSAQPKKFSELTEQILPTFLKIINWQLKKSEIPNEKNKIEIEEEIQINCQTLYLILKQSSAFLVYFVGAIFSYFAKIIDSPFFEEENKVDAFESYPLMIKLLKDSKMDFSKLQKQIISHNLESCLKFNESEELGNYLRTTVENLQNAGVIMNDDEVLFTFRQMMQILSQIEDRLARNKDFFDFEEEDKLSLEMKLEESLLVETRLMFQVAEIMGALFGKYKERTLNIFTTIFASYVSDFEKKRSAKKEGFVLAFIDQASEKIGEFMSVESLRISLGICLQFGMDKNGLLRNMAIHAIGRVVKALGANLNSTNFESCVKCLTQMIDLNEINVPDALGGELTRENAVAAFGKLLQVYQNSLSKERQKIYFQFWIRHLPLRMDLKEGKLQYEFLLKQLLLAEDKIGLTDEGVLKRVLVVLGEMKSDRRGIDVEFENKVELVFRSFLENKKIRKFMEETSCLEKENLGGR